jgi:hypothetical protein
MYLLTAFKNGYTCFPEAHWFTIIGADVTEMTFTLSPERTDAGSSSTTVVTERYCLSGYDCPSGICIAGVCP